MSAYIVLGNWTEQGVRNAKDTVNRWKSASEMMGSMKIRPIGIWWTLGQYDFVVVIEAPDDETATRMLLSLAKQGNVRTTTLRAFSEDEAGRIVQGL